MSLARRLRALAPRSPPAGAAAGGDAGPGTARRGEPADFLRRLASGLPSTGTADVLRRPVEPLAQEAVQLRAEVDRPTAQVQALEARLP
jgi:hypothetical protein